MLVGPLVWSLALNASKRNERLGFLSFFFLFDTRLNWLYLGFNWFLVVTATIGFLFDWVIVRDIIGELSWPECYLFRYGSCFDPSFGWSFGGLMIGLLLPRGAPPLPLFASWPTPSYGAAIKSRTTCLFATTAKGESAINLTGLYVRFGLPKGYCCCGCSYSWSSLSLLLCTKDSL